ncbi:MAG: ABC transporter permease [SAR202 cluster bacterium]|nr:ABC transporter permease [SAR202 cluster bacterium]
MTSQVTPAATPDSFAARQPGRIQRALSFIIVKWPVIPGVILGFLFLIAVLTPVIAPHDPLKANIRSRLAPPVWYEAGTSNFLLGADPIGRDVMSRLMYGARISLLVASVALVTGTIIGTTIGLIAGYYGGLIDEVLMRIVDIWFGLPFVLIALVIAVILSPSLPTMITLLALFTWAGFVRNVRGEVLTLKTRDYVSLARISGASGSRILIRHILPGVTNTVLVLASLRAGQLILTEAFLSFLGAGIPPPTATWGAMIADGRSFLRDAWWISVFPGIAIFLTVTSLNFLGDWVRDKLDPRLNQL